MSNTGLGLWEIPLAIVSGAIRVSTPFLFVSLGECITEKSGRINLGLEGILVLGAMVGYGISYLTGSPWLGVLGAACSGLPLGLLHGWLCGRRRVNDIAAGIAIMFFGIGVAFFFGRSLLTPQAAMLPSIQLGFWSHSPQVREALQVNALFIVGILLAPLIYLGLKYTRWGCIVRVVGESSDAAQAMGYSVNWVRIAATGAGGFLGAIGGAYLSLYYPGSWNQGIASGQGLMAVALVIFARWNPLYCVMAALLFGGAGAFGTALQSAGYGSYYYVFSAAPYILTLVIMAITCSRTRAAIGAPAELGSSSHA